MKIAAIDIRKLLDNGYALRSEAVGRMGEIVDTNGRDVVILTRDGFGVTRFDVGDPVKLEYKTDGGVFVITNDP